MTTGKRESERGYDSATWTGRTQKCVPRIKPLWNYSRGEILELSIADRAETVRLMERQQGQIYSVMAAGVAFVLLLATIRGLFP